MYNFIWDISKEHNVINSSIMYRAKFNPDLSSPIFKDFESPYTFSDSDTGAIDVEGSEFKDKEVKEWVENELIGITANYLSAIDPYNKLIDNTNINFNYINNEEKF